MERFNNGTKEIQLKLVLEQKAQSDAILKTGRSVRFIWGWLYLGDEGTSRGLWPQMAWLLETILDPGTQMQTSHLQVQWSHFGPLLTELRTPQRPQISSGISLTRSEMHSSRALRAFWLQCTQWSSAHSHRCSLSWGDAGKVSGPEEARDEERDDKEARSLKQSCPQAYRNLFIRAVE